MESVAVYLYAADGYYLGEGGAARDERHFERTGQTRYLIPRNATTSYPGTIPEGQRARWNGSSWNLEDLPPDDYVEISGVTKQIAASFASEVASEFPGSAVTEMGELDWNSTDSKTFRFDGVEGTSANSTTLQGLIDSHDYSAGKMLEVREERDLRLWSTDWKIRRHEDQTELVSAGVLTDTDFSAGEYVDWLKYRQALRDFPSVCDPTSPSWPLEPDAWHECAADAGGDTIIDAGHGLSDDDLVEFRAGTLPGGLAVDTTYYVVAATTDTYKVSTSLGGAAADLTSAGSGVTYRKRY